MVRIVGIAPGIPPEMPPERPPEFAMKQFLFLSIMTLLAMGVGLVAPFWAVAWYYFLAVMRPQYVWDWALPMEVRWSLIAGLFVIITFILNIGLYLKRRWMTPIVMLILAFSVLLIVSTVTAYDPGVAMRWLIEYGKVIVIALIACMVITHMWQLRVLAAMILLGVGYIAWTVNMDYLNSPNVMRLFLHGYGGLDNNGAGQILALGVPFCYAVFALPGKSWYIRALRWVSPVLALMMIHGVMLSYSRGAMLACVAGLVWLVIRHVPRKQAVIFGAVVTVCVLTMAGANIRDEFMSTRDFETDASSQQRLQAWSAAWDMAWDHPVTGNGVRNAGIHSYGFGADRLGRTIHNQYLQIAADTGIPAACVYIAMLAIAFRNSMWLRKQSLEKLREPKEDEDTEKYRSNLHLGNALESAFVTFGVGAMFLSLEVFELPWLMIVMASCIPACYAESIETKTITRPKHEVDPPASPLPREPVAPLGLTAVHSSNLIHTKTP